MDQRGQKNSEKKVILVISGELGFPLSRVQVVYVLVYEAAGCLLTCKKKVIPRLCVFGHIFAAENVAALLASEVRHGIQLVQNPQ